MMSCAKISIGMATLFFSSLAIANNFSVPAVNLGGVIVNHAVGVVNTRNIALSPLSGYGNLVRWNISCDYKIQENGGASAPSPSNPFVANVTIDSVYDFYGDNYGSEGFISESGTIKSNQVPAFEGGWGDQTTSIQFDNYDAKGDLIISNCIAKLVVP